MSADINRVILNARCVKDAELKYTGSGQAVVELYVASNRRVKKNGEWIDKAGFYNVTYWRGEKISQYLTKGTQISIDGQIDYDSWEQDGQKRSKVQIIADNIQLLGGKKDNTQESPYGQGSAQPSHTPDRFDDPIPF